MDLLKDSVIKEASRVRDVLGAGSDLWLAFCGFAQLPRYDLNDVLDGRRSVTPSTHLRVAAVLEQVGVETRLRRLNPDLKRVLIDLGLTQRGEVKDYFPHAWDRASLQRHLCRDEVIPLPMFERVMEIAKRIGSGQSITDKPKVALAFASAIKHELKGAPPAPPRAVMFESSQAVSVPTSDGQRSAAEAGVVTLNALATLFSATIQPSHVSGRTQQDLLLAITRILNVYGVSPDRRIETKSKQPDQRRGI